MDQSQVGLIGCLKFSMKDYIFKLKQTQKGGLSQNMIDQLLNPEELKYKRSIILKRAIGPVIEQDFRTTYLFFRNQSSRFDQELSKVYGDYINTYHQISSLYLIRETNNKNYLFVYNTESERKETKILEISESLSDYPTITQLPNGGLFFLGNGIAFIIDSNYELRKFQSVSHYSSSSAIYANGDIYCFGDATNADSLTRSRRFNFDRNYWMNTAPIPQVSNLCHSVMFNGNILISGWNNKNILLYSIDIDSFSTIPYEFSVYKRKILINVEERLYLFECRNGFIYESDVGNEYYWKKIKESIISDNPTQVYCSYNKGGIYIGSLKNNEEPCYYRFSLGLKLMTKL